MLLRNYDNFITAITSLNSLINYQSSVLSSYVDVFGDGHINVKNMAGKITQIRAGQNAQSVAPLSNFGENDNGTNAGTNQSSLIVGGGTKEVSYDDYCLDNQFTTSQVTYVSNTQTKSRVYDETENAWVSTYKRIMTAKEDITITEIGVKHFYYEQYSNTMLVYRELLETPIEVPANANFVLTFIQKIYANPNKPADYVATASVE